MASEKQKQKVNTAQSGVQKSGFHSGRPHPPETKIRQAKLDTSAQSRALKSQRTEGDDVKSPANKVENQPPYKRWSDVKQS